MLCITLAGGPANELFVGKPGGLAVEEYVIEPRCFASAATDWPWQFGAPGDPANGCAGRRWSRHFAEASTTRG